MAMQRVMQEVGRAKGAERARHAMAMQRVLQ